jgi:hypothetical protein
MNLLLQWKRHQTAKNTIIGICPELPDSFCYFYIMRHAQDKFWIAVPGLSADYYNVKLILRDADISRQFCLDYLNQNLKHILQHQISEMKRRSSASIKSRTYYENLLEQQSGRSADQPPKNPFRKAS